MTTCERKQAIFSKALSPREDLEPPAFLHRISSNYQKSRVIARELVTGESSHGEEEDHHLPFLQLENPRVGS